MLLVSLMLAVVTLEVAAVDTPPPFDAKALASCMAFVSQASDYSHLSDDAVRHSASFLADAMGICSEEIVPLWDEAHARARSELQLPNEPSHPMTPDEARRAMDEMDVAERQLRTIVAEHWTAAQGLRHQSLIIAPSVMAGYMERWLVGKQRADKLAQSAEKSLACVGAEIRKTQDVQVLTSAERTGDFDVMAHRCRLDAAVDAASVALQNRFITADLTVAHDVANSFFRQLVFWSLTGQHVSPP